MSGDDARARAESTEAASPTPEVAEPPSEPDEDDDSDLDDEAIETAAGPGPQASDYFREVAAAALGNATKLLNEWFPAGRLQGREFVVGNLSGDPGESLSINVETGVWTDFASTQKGGGDLISLRAAQRGCSQGEAAREIAETLGLRVNRKAQRDRDDRYEDEPVSPVPANAPDSYWFGRFLYGKLGAEGTAWRFAYRDAQGAPLFCVWRFTLPGLDEHGKKKKTIRPATLRRERGTGKLRWRSKWLNPPLPLYGLERLSRHPDLPALLLEGEKKTDDATELLKDRYVPVSLPSGAKSVSRVDLSSLTRNVVLWPDYDADGFGAMMKAARIGKHAPITSSIRIVKPDAGWPLHHDVDDLIQADWSAQQLIDYIERNSVSPSEFGDFARERFPELADKDDAGKKKKKEPSQAELLIAIGRRAELLHDGEDCFATCDVDGHCETYALRSKGFKRWLLKTYFKQFKESPNAEAVGAAVNMLEALAFFDGEERKTFVRVAGQDNKKIFLDLCNQRWQVVEIDADGWRVIAAKDCPTRFRRAHGAQALPEPERGGNINDLRRFLNSCGCL